jgi:CRISPR/Cas system-associated endonuclease Cas1
MNKISNNWFPVKKDARVITKCSVRRMSIKIFKMHQSVILICICSNKTERCVKLYKFRYVQKFKILLGQYGSVTGFMEQCAVNKSINRQLILQMRLLRLSRRLKISTASRQILYKDQLRNHNARSNNNFETITLKFLIISSSGVKELCKLK